MDRTDTQMAKSEDAKPAAGAVSHPSAARAPRQCSPARTCPAIQPSRAMAMPQSERHRQEFWQVSLLSPLSDWIWLHAASCSSHCSDSTASAVTALAMAVPAHVSAGRGPSGAVCLPVLEFNFLQLSSSLLPLCSLPSLKRIAVTCPTSDSRLIVRFPRSRSRHSDADTANHCRQTVRTVRKKSESHGVRLKSKTVSRKPLDLPKFLTV